MEAPGKASPNPTTASTKNLRAPNLLIVGAQKCGTHWLHANLKRHPRAFMSEEKEPHYFNRAELLTPAGFQAYLAEHFAGATDEAVLGEASTGYFRTRQGATRWANPKRMVDIPAAVLRFLGPEVRLVVGIRQPVERAISAYLHHWGKGRVEPGRSLLEMGPELGIVDIGFYHRHLTRWAETFARDRLHVVLLEDLNERPAQTFGELCRFLELDPIAPDEGARYKGFDFEWQGDHLVVSNAGLAEIRRKIAAGDLRLPADAEPPTISQAELGELQRIFDEDIQCLQDWLGRDLSHWRGDAWGNFVRYGRPSS